MNDENGAKTPVLFKKFGGLFIHTSVQPVVAQVCGWCEPGVCLVSYLAPLVAYQ